MAILYGLLAAVLLSVSVAMARPADSSPAVGLLDLEAPLTGAASTNPVVDPLENPRFYLIIAEAADDEDDEDEAEHGAKVEKRSADDQADDLEAAAGTNVLRPLFVYRQQLAYRERVKKGAIKRFGFRPRF